MATFVEVEEFIVPSDPPHKIQVNKDAVKSINVGGTSGKPGMPDYCVVEFTDGTSRKIKGTLEDVNAQLRG